MNIGGYQKIQAYHLQRCAYLYIRQSTLKQVFENTESTKRQYALQKKAKTLGWSQEQVVLIDEDLGCSGASAENRNGFQKLVADVSMDKVGLVIGLEVSRLARSSTDWHRLLEICALTNTLIMDEDGIYNPNDFNDRLLLGLKGTMSEAELHFIKTRMRGGLLNKAKRGELKIALPIGYVYDEQDQVIFDPDLQVQESIHQLFRLFKRTGSGFATLKSYNNQGLKFPCRIHKGYKKGELFWKEIQHSQILNILHNPRYTGAFCYGRRQSSKDINGKTLIRLQPQKEWHVLIKNMHPAYITWEEYEANQNRIMENTRFYHKDKQRTPPREGCALLQGLTICAICGQRMTVRYHTRKDKIIPDYICQRDNIAKGKGVCQTIPGSTIEVAITDLMLEVITPLAIEVTLAIQEEINARKNEIRQLHLQQVERARYEAELAKRRFLRVDPDNRLVATELEIDWNEKLRRVEDAQNAYNKHVDCEDLMISEDISEINRIVSNFPQIWSNENVPNKEKKRILQLIIEDVTLMKEENITMHIRFKGGAIKTKTIPRAKSAGEKRKTDPNVMKEIDRLLDSYPEYEVVKVLNEKGMKSGTGKSFTSKILSDLCIRYGLKSHRSRLKEAGMLSRNELATKLGVTVSKIKEWHEKGILNAHKVTKRNEYLYEMPDNEFAVNLKID